MKKALLVVLSMIISLTAVVFEGCGVERVEIDDSKTQLYIGNYSGGVGTKWLDEAIERFQAKYGEKCFEPGTNKKGAQIIVDHNKSFDGISLVTTIQSDNHDLYFTQNFDYYGQAKSGRILDISDLVKDKVCAEDDKTILSKMYEADKSSMSIDGKYYGLPHYEITNGLTYDAGLFKSKKLYFSDEMDSDGMRKFVTTKDSKLSCGPDGKYGTYDDGLPSSIKEFEKLIDKMTMVGRCIPFVFTGQSSHYTNMLVYSLFHNYIGADGVNALYNFDSNGKNIEIVDSVSGSNVKTHNEIITPQNAYKLRESAGLYYALSFAEKAFSDKKYYSTTEVSSNINAMETFLFSGLDGKNYTAMIIEGNYWYNEAKDFGIFDRLQKNYANTYTQKDFKFMPLPRQYAGTVSENEGKSPVVLDCYESFAVINANIDNSKINLAKEFLSFLYSDSELEYFSLSTNGVKKGLNYEYTKHIDKLDSYPKSYMEVCDAATKGKSNIKGYTNNLTYLSSRSFFNQSTTSTYLNSTINSQSFVLPYNVFKQKSYSAKEYFDGMKISESAWANYLK